MSKIEMIYEEDLITLNTLHKDNRTIRVKKLHKQGREAKLLYNYLYREAQLKIENQQSNEQGIKYIYVNAYDTTLTIPQMRKVLGLENTNAYIQIIEEAIEQLKQEYEIINYVDSEGVLWKSQKMRFINFDGKKQKNQRGEISYTLGISHHMYHIIKETHNHPFTELNFDILKKLNSNGISLYEWLKSYQNMNNGYCPPVNLEILNELFFCNYKYLSKVKTVLLSNMKSINKHTDINVEIVKRKNGRKDCIYLYVEYKDSYIKKLIKKEESVSNQKIGMSKASYKNKKDKEENDIINNLLNKKEF